MVTVLKGIFFFALALGGAIFIIDGVTGWGEKGQHGKSLAVSLVLLVVLFFIFWIGGKVSS